MAAPQHSLAAEPPAPGRGGSVMPVSTTTAELGPLMGPLELATYRRLWQASRRFLESLNEPLTSVARNSWRPGVGFAALRDRSIEDEDDLDLEREQTKTTKRRPDVPADAARVATDLLMARMFDE